jgi:tetratricopeptide (TPR) repeat protein
MKQLADGTLHPVQAKEAVRHLLAGCERCKSLAHSMEILSPAELTEYELTEKRLNLMFVLALNDVDVELRRGSLHWGTLRPLAPAQRLLVLRDNPQMCHWGLYKHLLDECASAGRKNPFEAVDIAFLALSLVETFDPESYGDDNIHDFKATALAVLANAKRHATDFNGAREALRAAYEHIEKGSGDPYEHANVFCYEALLLRDTGDFEGALAVLDKAYKLFKRVKDIHLCGRTIIQQAATIGYLEPMKGIELCKRGLEMIDLEKGDTFLELSARNLLAFFLNDAGFTEEAKTIQDTYRYLYAQFPSATVQGAMLWLDGLLSKNMGNYRQAELTLREVRALYNKSGFHFEEALVSLDLAETYLWSNNPTRAADLLQEVVPQLEEWGLEKHIIALWLSLENLIRARLADATSFFRVVSSATRKGWNQKRQISAMRIYPH